ncbi:hypothetical protein EXS61_01685 [Candidatus Parcubacteria bacterium]|nr:hypothetical protein [Candidatus Parcubacteria bacterium]
MKQTLSTIKVIILALVLGLGISYAQANWAPPLASPPTCLAGNPGCDAPLNVGATAQIKTGDLKVNNLEMSGTTLTTSGSTWVWGAMDIKGSKGGYSGINFKNLDGTNAGAFVMKSDGLAGFFNTSSVNNWSFIVYPNIAGSPGAVRIPGLAASPAAPGKVLTAVNVAGDATWQTPTASGASRPTVIYIDHTMSFHAASSYFYTGPGSYTFSENTYALSGIVEMDGACGRDVASYNFNGGISRVIIENPITDTIIKAPFTIFIPSGKTSVTFTRINESYFCPNKLKVTIQQLIKTQ